MRWSQFSGHIAFVLSVGLALLCVLAFKSLHKRAARKSPLSGKVVGHLPGQQLVQRAGDHHDDLLMAVMLMFLAFPLAFSTWAGARLRWDAIQLGFGEAAFALLGVGLFGIGLYRYIGHYRAREQARDGLLAERVTGMQLNRLVASGCRVLHDLPADSFNIDHVVVSPAGVYAIETKSFRKPKRLAADQACKVSYDGVGLSFPDFSTRAPIDQAVRQAKWLRSVLEEALRQDVPVMPAVALPGWYIDRTAAAKSADVRVFTPMGKGADFLAWGPERLSPQEREMIAQALALRYPRLEE